MFCSGRPIFGQHPEWIQQKSHDVDVKSKRHVDIGLKDEEQYIYINPKNGGFWFKGRELDVETANTGTSQPSVETKEPVASRSGLSLGSSRHSVASAPRRQSVASKSNRRQVATGGQSGTQFSLQRQQAIEKSLSQS